MHSVMEIDAFILLIRFDRVDVLDDNGLLGSKNYFLI